MRACMVGYAFYETDNRIRRYAEALVRRGDEVDAIVLRREGQAPFEIIKGVRVYRIQTRVRDERGPFSYLRKVLMFLFRSTRALMVQHLKARYDIIHVHSVPDFEVFATILPKLMGARVILDIHDIVPEFYASKFKVKERSLVFRWLLLLEKLSIAYSDHVIISNHLWRSKLIQRSVQPDKCTAIINYPDLSIFSRRPHRGPTNGDFIMCYPGTLNWHQGVDLAISAMALVRRKTRRCKFVIIGDGPDREKLKMMIRLNRLDDCVTMTGLVPLEQVAERMATIDLGVVPKRNDAFGDEAFSTKIMEFMAMGVPVVVSKTRIDQHYFNEHLVQFVEPESAEDLAAKILELASDPAKCEALRGQGIDFIDKNNWDVRKNEYLDLVDGLLKRQSVGSQVQSGIPL